MEGNGELLLTGHLGDVMKESAKAALSYIRANASRLDIPPKIFSRTDLHIHVPSGATPKDGPSAGVAIAVALASLLTGRRTRSDLAMTGEISLRGKVLPVGGIKEKALAAQRAGMKSVMIPKLNERDLGELPEVVRQDIAFIPVDDIEGAIKVALEKDT
jgi:ATP-dependent Lon protease